MAESMKGMHRTHRCTELSTADIGQTATVMGWVQKSRNKGGIIFVDLRDRSGILQIIFEQEDIGQEGFEKADKLRSEFVIAVTGRVEARSGAVNENLLTGEIELRAKELRILSEAETPPFPIEEGSKTKEELRLNVYQKNKRAIHFYLREGFEIRREGLDENTGEKECEMIWCRK